MIADIKISRIFPLQFSGDTKFFTDVLRNIFKDDFKLQQRRRIEKKKEYKIMSHSYLRTERRFPPASLWNGLSRTLRRLYSKWPSRYNLNKMNNDRLAWHTSLWQMLWKKGTKRWPQTEVRRFASPCICWEGNKLTPIAFSGNMKRNQIFDTLKRPQRGLHWPFKHLDGDNFV